MRSAFALKRYGGQLSRDHGSAEVGAGYGDRTLLTCFSKLVMARDFWRTFTWVNPSAIARCSSVGVAIPGRRIAAPRSVTRRETSGS